MGNVPRPIASLLALLNTRDGDEKLAKLPDEAWREILDLADRTHLTLHIEDRLPQDAPAWLRTEIARRFARNQERRRKLTAAYEEVGAAFSRADLDFVCLKGITHETGFGIHPRRRVQYDLDFLFRTGGCSSRSRSAHGNKVCPTSS